eukprot:CAMPEP_0197001150 /NCGR_PEP_ID=MMETSP1380-20130617/5912_1 /TAXON_ID=5936 /ORGANISM="Euplotes crassus, Strain CT5" /LENGTH=192 /DNA_ID=CAMNT_0042418699 /DNA_START=242 /DNA_END=821 /DNA_ORIENTATION=-
MAKQSNQILLDTQKQVSEMKDMEKVIIDSMEPKKPVVKKSVSAKEYPHPASPSKENLLNKFQSSNIPSGFLPQLKYPHINNNFEHQIEEENLNFSFGDESPNRKVEILLEEEKDIPKKVKVKKPISAVLGQKKLVAGKPALPGKPFQPVMKSAIHLENDDFEDWDDCFGMDVIQNQPQKAEEFNQNYMSAKA